MLPPGRHRKVPTRDSNAPMHSGWNPIHCTRPSGNSRTTVPGINGPRHCVTGNRQYLSAINMPYRPTRSVLSSTCFSPSGLRYTATPRNVALPCLATCPSMWHTTVPTSGPILRCSVSIKRVHLRLSPGYHRIISLPPVSAGAILCIAGIFLNNRIMAGGWIVSGPNWSSLTCCGWITFAASSNTGKCQPRQTRPLMAAG